jgi:DNA-directed RNA polymerase subunit beta
MKAPPSTKGVVIDKKLFSRAIKDKKSKGNEKGSWIRSTRSRTRSSATLKTLLVDKLMKLIGGLNSNGVSNKYKEEQIKKGVKFSPKVLQAIDFVTVDPTTSGPTRRR